MSRRVRRAFKGMGCLSPERQRIAKDIAARLAPYEPQRVIVFGSFARNESDGLSDIDLVILKDTDEDFFSRMRSALKTLDLDTAVDILVYTPAEFDAMEKRGNTLIETVLQEGVELQAAERIIGAVLDYYASCDFDVQENDI